MTKPRSLNPLADEILERLARYPEASEIVLGGYLALQHHIDYRVTRDIDAWWRARASETALDAIRSTMTEVGARHGYVVRERSFGDTFSFELLRGSRKEFSFQIAVRTVQLEAPQPSAWPPIAIETLYDNAGSKMNALVNRGAPRDFLDIKRVVDSGLLSVDECWALWARKNPGQAIDAARRRVLLALANLSDRRPLDSIADPYEREQATALRDWYRTVFVGNDVH